MLRPAQQYERGWPVDVEADAAMTRWALSQPRTDLEPPAPVALPPRDEMHYGADSDDPYEASMERYHGMPREVDPR